MDLTAHADLALAPSRVFPAIADLGTYPAWSGIVGRAVPADASADHDDPGPAWVVDLVARVGPFSRSKRVRMVRAECDGRTHARFRRRELDGRSHSEWVLEATITPVPAGRDTEGCRLDMHLHYGGARWVPGLEVLLREEAKRAGGRLERHLRADG